MGTFSVVSARESGKIEYSTKPSGKIVEDRHFWCALHGTSARMTTELDSEELEVKNNLFKTTEKISDCLVE